MDKPPDDHMNDNDELMSLIKAAGQNDRPDFVRPPIEIIEAYLTGRASEEQQRLVLEAMNNSVRFRKEMMTMAADFEDWTSRETLEELDAHKPVSVPDLPTIESASTSVQDIDRSQSTGIQSIVSTHWMKIAVSAAAVIVIAIVGWQLATSPTEPQHGVLVANRVEPSSLLSTHLRGEGAAEKITAANAKEAALISFRRALILDGDQIGVDPAYQSPVAAKDQRYLQIDLKTPDGKKVTDVDVLIPADRGDGSDNELMLWYLGLPTRRLMKISAPSEKKISVVWEAELGSEGIICATLKVNDTTFISAPPTVFETNR